MNEWIGVSKLSGRLWVFFCQKIPKVDDTGFTSYTLINPMFWGQERMQKEWRLPEGQNKV